jgi:hypothetical protein
MELFLLGIQKYISVTVHLWKVSGLIEKPINEVDSLEDLSVHCMKGHKPMTFFVSTQKNFGFIY